MYASLTGDIGFVRHNKIAQKGADQWVEEDAVAEVVVEGEDLGVGGTSAGAEGVRQWAEMEEMVSHLSNMRPLHGKA